MRISDWSSDVCASDLGGEVDGGRAQRPRHADAAVAVLNLDFAQVACVEKFGKLPDQIGIDLHGCALGRGIGHLNPCFTYDSRSSPVCAHPCQMRSEEHTSELQSLMRISYAVFCLKKKKKT